MKQHSSELAIATQALPAAAAVRKHFILIELSYECPTCLKSGSGNELYRIKTNVRTVQRYVDLFIETGEVDLPNEGLGTSKARRPTHVIEAARTMLQRKPDMLLEEIASELNKPPVCAKISRSGVWHMLPSIQSTRSTGQLTPCRRSGCSIGISSADNER
jgi:hypothetical protein